MSLSNVRLLAIRKMSRDAVPPGGGFEDGVRFLLDKDAITKSAQESEAWVRDAIAAVRSAADPNPWRDATDEEIAAEILRQMEVRTGPSEAKER